MTIDGNATAVVDDRNRTVDVDRGVDLIAESCQRLVDRVVDYFVDQMMQAGGSRRPDIHGGALTDGVEPFENFDFIGGVVVPAQSGRRGGSGVGRRISLSVVARHLRRDRPIRRGSLSLRSVRGV